MRRGLRRTAAVSGQARWEQRGCRAPRGGARPRSPPRRADTGGLAALHPPAPRPRGHMVRTWRQSAALIGHCLPRGGAVRPSPPMRGAGVPRVTSRVAELGAERTRSGAAGGACGEEGGIVPPGRGHIQTPLHSPTGALPLFTSDSPVTPSSRLCVPVFVFWFLCLSSSFIPLFPPRVCFSLFFHRACAAFLFSFNFTKG